MEVSSDSDVTNPFLDVSVSACFMQENQRCEVDGFYDGMQDDKHIWRVRFAPMREGRWTFTVRSNVVDLCRDGEFACIAPASSGGLRVDPLFNNWFIREDGTHQWISNDGWYPHVANRSGTSRGELAFEDVDFPQPSEDDFVRYLDLLADHGVNFVIDIGQLYARQSTITDVSFRWPWRVVDRERNQIDRERFNLDYYQRMDRQMRHAQRRGIFFAMELLYDNSVVRPRDWAHHPSNVANGGWLRDDENGVGWRSWFALDNAEHVEYVRRYVDYTWARYGAFWNVVWSVGSENGNLAKIYDERLPQAGIDPQIPADWYAYWTDRLNRMDPYGRLKSYGDAGRQETMVNTAYNDFIITQDPRNYPKQDVRDSYRAMSAFGAMMWNFGKPVVVGEMTAANNGDYESERRLYWVAFTAGYAMGRSDRHFSMITGNVMTESIKFGVGADVPPIYTAIRLQRDFIESRRVPFWRMRPSNHLVEPSGDSPIFCLAADGEEYVVYFAAGGSADLKTPSVSVEWFDPRSGASTGVTTQSAGHTTFAAPDEQDWVLHLRAVSPDAADAGSARSGAASHILDHAG